MTAPDSRDVVIFSHLYSRNTQMGKQRVVVATAERRMRLVCRAKVWFDANVNLHAPALEPASAPLRKFRRFRDLNHAQQIAVEPACFVFLANGHGELHVIDAGKRAVVHKYFRLSSTRWN